MRWKASNPFPVSGESGLRKVLAMSDRERNSNHIILAADTGIVDLKEYATQRGRNENCVVALKCNLISPTRREVTIAVGSDDGCILQVGDQVLVEDFAQQGVDPMRHLVTANLERGVNPVVLLVENGGGSFGASLRVLDDAVTVQQQDAEQSKNAAPTSKQRASSDMAGIRAAADLFFLDEGRWPKNMEELTTRYLEKLPLDPWGRPYQIHSSQTRLEVVSLGADGSRGGNGINADIISQR